MNLPVCWYLCTKRIWYLGGLWFGTRETPCCQDKPWPHEIQAHKNSPVLSLTQILAPVFFTF